MLSENERKRLVVDLSDGATLEGFPCHIAGWRNPSYCCITAAFAGFWVLDWESVKRVLEADKRFSAGDVYLQSWGWSGTGVNVPEALLEGVSSRF